MANITTENNKKDTNTWEILAFGVIFLGLVIPIGLQYLYFNTFVLLDIEKQGKLGPVSDWLSGIITPCIALASFILLYRTYCNQKEELKLTRGIMNQQKFETTFFNLLNLFNGCAKNVSYKILTAKGTLEYCGQEYFKHMHFQIFESSSKSNGNKNLNLLINLEQNIGSYIEVLRSLLGLVDSVQGVDRETFIGILKATMSAEAKYAVYYYLEGSLVKENKSLFELVTKYDICDMVKKAEFARKFNERMNNKQDNKNETEEIC